MTGASPAVALVERVANGSERLIAPESGHTYSHGLQQNLRARAPFVTATWPWFSILTIGAALLLGVAARLRFFLVSDFPLNDGGLFLLMAKEIADAGFKLPTVSAYHLDASPNTYPPLSFYLAALTSRLSGVDLPTVVRYLPLLGNLLAIATYYRLARSLMVSKHALFVAVTMFPLIPRSFEWLIMGGGLTRSFGFLFALLALSEARALYSTPTARRVLWCGVFVGLAVVTHLELAVFLTYSFSLFFLCFGRSVAGIRSSFLVGLCVLGVTSPWWLTFLVQHGLAPFGAASATAGWAGTDHPLSKVGEFLFQEKPILSLLAGLGVLGALVCLLRADWLLPVWLTLIFTSLRVVPQRWRRCRWRCLPVLAPPRSCGPVWSARSEFTMLGSSLSCDVGCQLSLAWPSCCALHSSIRIGLA